jgi:4-amino-4-deoxy-L-arabinose transferase-like glycosyltransferase
MCWKLPESMLEKIKKLLTPEYISVSVILLISYILRVFRIDKILGFYYDQGRDAQVIWDLIHSHKFFLIGPTTGLAGVFRGPFYYYLIAPFYYLGNGSPLTPAIFLALLSTAALGIMYYLARQIGGRRTGIIALILGSFSFEIIYASRWLSNPTPMLFLSMILVWMMFLIQDGKKWPWVILAFVLGSSFFHFGSSGELFYFPAVAIFAIWQFVFVKGGKKNIPNLKIIVSSIVVFLITFSPLFIFNLKHGNILSNNIAGLVGSGKSFGIPNWQFISDRLSVTGVYFSSLLFHSPYAKEWIHMLLIFILFIAFLPKLFKNDRLKIIFILLGSVTFGLLFFQGNNGNLYQYYLTGYYLIFLILAAALFNSLFESSLLGKIVVIYLLLFFLSQNWSWIRPYIYTTGTEPDMIVLSNQKQAIDWVYKNAGARDFNVDEYVPPVIPYAYDYLFKWLGTSKYHKLSLDSQVSLLYTLYEADPPHPERLKAWLDRQTGIGRVIREQTFGGITVQERQRITKK